MYVPPINYHFLSTTWFIYQYLSTCLSTIHFNYHVIYLPNSKLPETSTKFIDTVNLPTKILIFIYRPFFYQSFRLHYQNSAPVLG
jgi:hypothetical protein